MVVGLARGSAAARAAVLPAFALILAFAVIAFAAMARGAVARADVAASWQAAGADAVVTAPATGPGITPAAQRLITGVPGVRRTATISVTPGTIGPRACRCPPSSSTRGSTRRSPPPRPAPPFPAAALARPGAAPRGRVRCRCSSHRPRRAILGPGSTLAVAGRQLRLRLAGSPGQHRGRAGREPVPGAAPVGAARTTHPSQRDRDRRAAAGHGRAAPGRSARAVPGARITLRSRRAGRHRPLAAAARRIRHLRPGCCRRWRFQPAYPFAHAGAQRPFPGDDAGPADHHGPWRCPVAAHHGGRGLPSILAAAVGGTACALALVPLVGPAVDLAAFTGMPVNVPLQVGPAGSRRRRGRAAAARGGDPDRPGPAGPAPGHGQALRVGE